MDNITQRCNEGDFSDCNINNYQYLSYDSNTNVGAHRIIVYDNLVLNLLSDNK